MILKEETTQVGYIQKPHGIKGELVLSLAEGIYSDSIDPEFILLDIDEGLVPFYVESYRVKSNKSLLVKFESVESESQAKSLSGSKVFLEASVFNERQEAPHIALVGFDVTDQTKGYIGKITQVKEISNNPLFEIDFNGKEILIPINSDFIVDVLDEEKMMQVNVPEGLIDLYLSDTAKEDDFI